MARSAFLSAEWRYLAMLNYEIDPAVLTPFVPAGTVLDLWQSRCLVSIVGFLFLNTRVLGVPIPFHRNFEEVNLRFYVRRECSDGSRRGVVFIKELVPRRAIAFVARTIYGENYHRVPMRHSVDLSQESGGDVSYSWTVYGTTNALHIAVADAPTTPLPGSNEEFIAEHYWGYARQRDGGTVEYEVEHPPWKVWRATSASLAGDVGPFYGQDFAEAFRTQPTSPLLAEGSLVTVYAGKRIV